MTRREAREQAFIFIFEKMFNDDIDIDQIIKTANEAREIVADKFALKIISFVLENKDEIDSLIEDAAIGWNKDRISKVSLSILRIAICEMKFFEDIPISVSINEAVELAKKYATTDDASYINGILGTLAKKIS